MINKRSLEPLIFNANPLFLLVKYRPIIKDPSGPMRAAETERESKKTAVNN